MTARTPMADTTAPAGAAVHSGPDMARKQIRGSSLLMSGKLLAVGAKLIAQVLVVRYLTKADYGIWAYGLTAVALLGGFAHLSLDRTVSRFASIYHEQGQLDRFFGTIVLVLGIAIGMSTLMVAGLYTFPELFGRLTGDDPATRALLLVLVFLVPLEAIDTLLTAIFASFSRPRAIFVRRYVVTPLVQVSVVGLLVLLRADLRFLAFGYLTGTVIGVLISGWMLLSLLREQHLLRAFSLRRLTVPARELFSFSVPLMTSDGLSALMHASGALVLGYLFGAEDVALFRVVMPIAVLNQLVLQTFHMLYVPTASRLFARGDMDAVNDLYWRTSLWIAVLTFPLFAVTFTAATPLTVLLFGAEYAPSGTILTILVFGQYVQASFGFNGSTLKVVGRVGYIVRINFLTALVHVALTAALIPSFGAVGAAIALSGSMVVYNVLKQLGLRAAGIRLLDPRYVAPFQIIAGAALALLVIRLAGVTHLAITGTLAVGAALYVLLSTRHTLRIAEVFPEVRRVPLLRILET